MDLIIERLPKSELEKALSLVAEVFANEQKIPVELHNIDESLKPVWWCVRDGAEIIGIVAAWIESDGWHWGRFAVKQKLRGLGIGKKLAGYSLQDIFSMGADEIHIDARNVTIGIIKHFGGNVTGDPVIFYGEPVTPMILKKSDFLYP